MLWRENKAGILDNREKKRGDAQSRDNQWPIADDEGRGAQEGGFTPLFLSGHLGY